MSQRSILLRALATLTLLACDGRPPGPSATAPQPAHSPPKVLAPEASASVSPAEPPLPPGVLAIVPGKTGLIRVEQSAPFRLLTIDGVLHAAQLEASADAALAPFDPLVDLLSEISNPDQMKALIIGLGSGTTATTLASTGYAVEVAEIDPGVIDVARRFFDYRGHAEAIDGRDWLRRDGPAYGLILLDAFSGTNLSSSFVNPDSIPLLRKRLAPGGLLAVRLVGAPRDPNVLAAIRVFGDAFGSKRLMGTGAADEPQNLYLLLSDNPLRLFDPDVGLVFPLPWPDTAIPPGESATEATRREIVMGKQPRRAALMGYLVRGEDGTLCIDLPHWEMGARRYILRGTAAESFKKLLPAKLEFPTQGDLSTDGDVSKTLFPLLGGGGVKLSTVRFSPVVVAVEGSLSPRRDVPQDKLEPPRSPPRGGAMLDPFDTRGFMTKVKGILDNARAEINIERVHFTLEHQQWQEFRQKKLRPLAARAVKTLGEAKFDEARIAIEGIISAFDAKFGRFAPRMVTYEEFVALRDVLHSISLPNNGSEKVAGGVNCDRVRHAFRTKYGGAFWGSDDGTELREMGQMLGALYECAIRHYGESTGKNPVTPEQRASAARLISLLDDPGWAEFNAKKRDAFQDRSEKLRKQWDIEGADEPL